MIRIDNLKLLMKERAWKKADLARALSFSDAYAGKLVNGIANFGEKAARDYEQRLNKPRGWFDQIHLGWNYSEESIKEASNPELISDAESGISQTDELTNRKQQLSGLTPYTVQTTSDKKSVRAPVVVWARMGTDLYIESKELQASLYLPVEEGTSSKAKWFIVESAMPRFRITQGDRLLICPIADDRECRDGKLYVFQTLSGEFVLAEFRRLVGGYEAIPDSGSPLESGKHGIKVVGKKLAQYDAD